MLEILKKLDKKTKIMGIVAILLVVLLLGGFIWNKVSERRQRIDAGLDEPFDREDIDETCPIDFEKYEKINEDVYAYIEMPDADISYPILQRVGDDSYYAFRTIDGKEGLPGVIYTEECNTQNFSDNNTIVYGHNMNDGSMFHNLHKFEDKKFFNKDHEFYVYTPEKKMTYKVFAAACISDDHLMHKYSFTTSQGNAQFAEDLEKIDNKYSHYKKNTKVTEQSRFCTLLTCMPAGMDDKRYVVVGYLTDIQTFKGVDK